jgi:hypothetical protein
MIKDNRLLYEKKAHWVVDKFPNELTFFKDTL